jgi:hypothetical protein
MEALLAGVLACILKSSSIPIPISEFLPLVTGIDVAESKEPDLKFAEVLSSKGLEIFVFGGGRLIIVRLLPASWDADTGVAAEDPRHPLNLESLSSFGGKIKGGGIENDARLGEVTAEGDEVENTVLRKLPWLL